MEIKNLQKLCVPSHMAFITLSEKLSYAMFYSFPDFVADTKSFSEFFHADS
jgi:hypothetical protein